MLKVTATALRQQVMNREGRTDNNVFLGFGNSIISPL